MIKNFQESEEWDYESHKIEKRNPRGFEYFDQEIYPMNRYLMNKYQWLVFLTDPLSDSEKSQLEIPYNCLFIIAQPGHDAIELMEVYKIVERKALFSLRYGTWDDTLGLSSTDLSLDVRRRNLNNSVWFSMDDIFTVLNQVLLLSKTVNKFLLWNIFSSNIIFIKGEKCVAHAMGHL